MNIVTKAAWLVGICGVAAVAIGSTVVLGVAPAVTIASPSQAAVIKDKTLQVTGTFTTDTDVKSVQAVLCAPKSTNPTICEQYVQTTTGTMGSQWRSLSTTLATTDNRSGSYSLDISGLHDGNYRLAVFATDQTTDKGPRVYVNFSKKTDDTPLRPETVATSL